MKRGFDIIGSFAALVVLAPVLVLIAVAIKVDSRGPVLFVQRRVGLGGVTFSILKFRTMVHRAPDAIDQVAEDVVSGGRDRRITRVGRVLRSTSLDEIPQLINVLRGEMSLVGPRPVLPAQLRAVPPDRMARFAVRPGITGLAQVRGRRGLGWSDQLAADVEYARSHPFRRDLVILLSTVKVVLVREGIYADSSKNWRAYLPDDSLGSDSSIGRSVS